MTDLVEQLARLAVRAASAKEKASVASQLTVAQLDATKVDINTKQVASQSNVPSSGKLAKSR